ncbi:ribokinase [Parafannyhessea umbonata]|uniref:Ribokinase n=1 Tax=Parafannyhessea umbonata TaxID=604330 RepID=A0A1G6IFD0_9ACTN|nr:ribokinase [Parafannyhessea umbonata]MBM6988872.1 ribokinase [Parafannyhessea umbonata]SDC05252.1 ribokinase [Parafannyhessea umbonata]
MRILDFGSLNIDYVYQVDHMVRPGETLAAGRRDVYPGGKGLNQAVACARAGAKVWQAGLVGPEGGLLLDVCREAGVNTDFVRTVDVASGHTVIQVDRGGQNCILLYGGANQRIDEAYADEVLSHFSAGDYVILQNEISCLPHIVDAAAARGMRVVLNPSPYNEALEAVDMSKVSLFLLNEVEGAQVTGGSEDPDEVLARLGEKYPDAAVVLTLGSEGSRYQRGDERYAQGIYHVDAKDTTAAGDTFTGYFVWAVSEGRPVPEALDIAAKASAIAVSRAGAVPSIPTIDEVMAAKL